MVWGSVACHDDDEPPSKASAPVANPAPRGVEQVTPPLDLQKPPVDATKTASGLIYKRLVASPAGAQPRPDDTVRVRYTGWRRGSGATFFTTRSRDQPITLDVSRAAPAFAEALPLLHTGETAMLWVPPSQGTPEAIVYEVELVDIAARPAVATTTTSRSAREASGGTATPPATSPATTAPRR